MLVSTRHEVPSRDGLRRLRQVVLGVRAGVIAGVINLQPEAGRP
jgi:hypothetical protein